MDFAYHYTEEQERFRREVRAWLEENLPRELRGSGDLRGLDPGTWEQCRTFRRRLGRKGWLAPTAPRERGGGGASRGQEVVLFEELESRGLRWLVEDTTSLLRAIEGWSARDQQQKFPAAIAAGRVLCWRPLLEPGGTLDPRNLGVHAFRDGDDYVLNGEELFAGPGPRPDYLWTLALHDPQAPPKEALTTFLVPESLEGISIQTPRRLVPGEAHLVTFDHARVPPYCLLGNEGDGWVLAHSTILAKPGAVRPPLQDSEVAGLLDYGRVTTFRGSPSAASRAAGNC